MANLGRNEPNTTNNTPAPHQIGFDDFLSALMALKTEEPSASQATAGYQHGILNQFSVPEPTIDEAPVYPTPTNRQFPGKEKKDDKEFRQAAEFIHQVGLQLAAAQLDPYSEVHPMDQGIRNWLHTYPKVWNVYVDKDFDRRIWLADARLNHHKAQQAAPISRASDRHQLPHQRKALRTRPPSPLLYRTQQLIRMARMLRMEGYKTMASKKKMSKYNKTKTTTLQRWRRMRRSRGALMD
ncbi:uncharacterized protein J4E79_010020 [Alternaria viburni]|uniref:uncharacterized protein n=1 Tax=Alternaria viburni TaxID=566460 RepID=UPI0020C4A6F3|nr:uncharacterized protein J4E79_010020 [Alternaria viburni]KAI4648398.1 hypothetical protein J4E79_010020 [Alternaria viburni]